MIIKIHHEANFAKDNEKLISRSLTPSPSERLSLDLASRTFEMLPKDIGTQKFNLLISGLYSTLK
jgi:hypothetical protein